MLDIIKMKYCGLQNTLLKKWEVKPQNEREYLQTFSWWKTHLNTHKREGQLNNNGQKSQKETLQKVDI